MRIHFHGAAQTVTGSQHLLEINGSRLLLECGLFQGRRAEAYDRNLRFPFNPRTLDAVILSHAHIDHSGNLPNLVRQGFRGRIYATHATAHLANVMLMDSGHIQEADITFLNKKRLRRGQALLNPIYTMEDAAHVAQYFECVKYGELFEPIPGVRAYLVDAGHILGSASVSLEIEEKGHPVQRLWFSGDIGRRNLPLIKDPVLPEAANILIMESTYGDKIHQDPQEAFEEMREVVIRTVNRGGKVIIPAFAVGRTQEIVYNLHKLMNNHDIPEVPVIVDSPLAINVNEIFKIHDECFDQETQEFIRQDRHKTLFGFDHLVYTRSVEESKALNDRRDPMIIISASGMAEHGRILHHLKNNVENPLNTVMIVSWQAPYTLGRRLADRDEEVVIFGEVYQRRCEIATIGGLSAHAGQPMLVEYAERLRSSVKDIFLVHGEDKAAKTLMNRLEQAGLRRVFYPELHSRAEY
jgi:metallo-beta-lactamase family protein